MNGLTLGDVVVRYRRVRARGRRRLARRRTRRRSSRCSARPAAASRPCCARSRASSPWPAAPSLGRLLARRRAGAPARVRADVPGRAALRAPDRRRERRLRPARPLGGAAASPSCSSSSAWPATRTAPSRPCPAANASASPWPAPSPRHRGCCCSTSPCPPSTARCASASPSTCAPSLVATGTTAVFVTHDQDEAFAVADRVAVMAAGRLLQVDAPADLWVRPATREVASFLGYEAFVPLDSPAAAPLRDALDVPRRAVRRSRSRKGRSSSGAPASPRAPCAGSRRDEDGPRCGSTSTGSAWSPRSGRSAGGGRWGTS